jgi:type II secretory pathway pseudopilin PulG
MITLSKKPKGPKKEAGFTLIATIIFIILIGFLGVTASFLFTSGTTTTKDYLLSTQAFYAAEGGIERGIRQFLLNANGTHYNGEPINLTMGSQTFPVTISVSSLGTNQYNITSSCTYQSATRVVQQTVQMQSVFSQSTNTPSYVPYAITSGGNIILGGTTYTTCPGGSGCPSYLSTYQPQAPITVVSTGIPIMIIVILLTSLQTYPYLDLERAV